MYASLLRILGALHLGIFEQPARESIPGVIDSHDNQAGAPNPQQKLDKQKESAHRDDR
jgi:hypothetical protein